MEARLNNEQYRASRARGGVQLVLAGAGTGKSKTLIEKIRSLLLYTDLTADRILVLTFSRKAVEEVRRRVRDRDDIPAESLTVETFHSFCFSLLKRYREDFCAMAGYGTFPRIIDEEESRQVFREIVVENLQAMKGLPAGAVCRLATSSISDTWVLRKLEGTGLAEELELLRERYRQYKIDRGLIDFHDMVHSCLDLLRHNKMVLDKVSRRFRYILVDEFQDTSREQFMLLELLVKDRGNSLFVVGDDWQAIYGFRDARVEYIVNMKKFFPGVHIHTLTINYRSRREIVELSNRFIRRNRFRTSKRLVSQSGRGGIVAHRHVSGFEEEGEVISEILRDCPGPEAAVLYRNNRQGEYLRNRVVYAGDRVNVHFLTMHASKGLEFPTVIISGISDAIIPDRSTPIEEERRLFYVALTRARERLYLIFHRNGSGEPPLFCRELRLR